jgi:long-chain acyl-CoA synthetase
VQARILGADTIKRFVYRLLMPIGYKVAELKYRRQRPGVGQKILYYFSDIFLFRSIKRSLGLSNTRICYTTGAILSPDAFRFYHALNIPLKSLYGTTEGGMLTGARNDEIHFETVGPADEKAEVKISPNGEINYRQPGTFIGYYRDPEGTAAVLKDGWFHSGDSGLIREDGHLVFTDRIKDLMELPNGHIVAPQSIESRLRSSPHIKDAWIMNGLARGYLSVIIVINYDNVSRWAGKNKVAFTSFAELSQTPEVYELIRQDIDRVNQTLPAVASIKKYINFHKEFDPDEGELTRTRILKRSFLEERYRKVIDAVYNNNDAVSIETGDGYRDGRMATRGTSLRIQSVKGAG